MQKAALVILWMAMQGDDITCSKTCAEAAGLDGKQKWDLVLSSSTRTQMTYQTVKTKKEQHQPRCSLTESAGGGQRWPVPRTVRSRASWQRREHACRPSEGEGSACSKCVEHCNIIKSYNNVTCDEYAVKI